MSGRLPTRLPANRRDLALVLLKLYRHLEECYGPQRWWPAEEPFEVMVGAILTQSTAWINVEKAIANLKSAGSLSPAALRNLPLPELSRLIRPALYHNMKALKLKALTEALEPFGDDLDLFFAEEVGELRKRLLSIYGVGEETADSIILYAAGKPIFVIDAYTRRILERLGLGPEKKAYSAYQALFMENLPSTLTLFNEYHGLFVRHGKETCRSMPLCPSCCILEMCQYGQRQNETV